ncbi:Isoprene synthase, chloroplastic [Glycine soja]
MTNVFERFKDKDGELKGDVQGLLSLYEAPFLGFEGENLLDEARAFSITHLKNNLNIIVAEQVSHALELPYHRRLYRLEARWYLDKYEPTEPHHQLLATRAACSVGFQHGTRKSSENCQVRWWNEMGLTSKLEFVRDRLMEVYFWVLGMAPDPQFSECRKVVTKMFGLVTIIDDLYDVYGTLDEIQLFTDAIESGLSAKHSSKKQNVSTWNNYHLSIKNALQAELERGETTNSITSHMHEKGMHF